MIATTTEEIIQRLTDYQKVLLSEIWYLQGLPEASYLLKYAHDLILVAVIKKYIGRTAEQLVELIYR
jgi:hypothetical protein